MKHIAFIILFLNSLSALGEEVTIAADKVKIMAAEYLAQQKLGYPQIFSEQVRKELNLSYGFCDSKSLTAALSKCTPHKCLQKTSFAKVELVEEIFVAPGSDPNLCLFTTTRRQFKVPLKAREQFADGFMRIAAEDQVADFALSLAVAENGSYRYTYKFEEQGKPCAFDLHYVFKLHGGNYAPFSEPPRKHDGAYREKTANVYVENGISYKAIDAKKRVLSSAVLELILPSKKNEPLCEGSSILWPLILERIGMVTYLFAPEESGVTK